MTASLWEEQKLLRAREIQRLHDEGNSMELIASKHGTTRERVRQILKWWRAYRLEEPNRRPSSSPDAGEIYALRSQRSAYLTVCDAIGAA